MRSINFIVKKKSNTTTLLLGALLFVSVLALLNARVTETRVARVAIISAPQAVKPAVAESAAPENAAPAATAIATATAVTASKVISKPLVLAPTANNLLAISPRDELAEITEKLSNHQTPGMESFTREKDSNAIRITLSSDTFFELGSAKLESKSISAIQEIVDTLKPLSASTSIEIEGHTDDSPVIRQRVNYPSNWELSAARAASLIPLFINGGFVKDQLKVSGFGDSHPIFPNESDNRSNAKNRRIVLRVIKRG